MTQQTPTERSLAQAPWGEPTWKWPNADLRFVLEQFEAMGLQISSASPIRQLLETIRDELASRSDACIDCRASISGEACIRARCLVCELDKAAAQPDPDYDGGEQQCPRCNKLALLAAVAVDGDAICIPCLDADVSTDDEPEIGNCPHCGKLRDVDCQCSPSADEAFNDDDDDDDEGL